MRTKTEKEKWLINQIETCPYNNKLILPLSVDETVTRNIYRKDPKTEKSIIMGQSSSGVNDLIETGDILNNVLKDVFTDVDLYDDQIRLLQYPFTSPIGKDAISFTASTLSTPYTLTETSVSICSFCPTTSRTSDSGAKYGFWPTQHCT